ncbi:PDZ domain-containing protein [Candidatus Peregrinibacteria bacterium]|nr:PDZ domain-containing protein [Candidatus Peregrinibacteria bacterium]
MYRSRTYHYFVYIIVAIFSFILGWQATSMGFLDGEESVIEYEKIEFEEDSTEESIDLDLFWTVWGELNNHYVDDEAVTVEDKVYGAIKGMVNSYDDPYTIFMTPEESEKFSANLEGTLEGIGAELTVEDHNLVIVSPLRDSPAEKAGLLPGDIVFMIDGKLASEMTLFDAIMKIRGEKGTTVNLSIIREDLSEPFDVSIVRDSISIESVTVEKLDNNIVYLSVNQFNDKTNEEFGNAISEMILDEPKGLIVDLRFNGGGYLDIAVELLSYMLPSDNKAVIIKQREKEDNVMYTNGKPKLLNVPLVVLVNEGSASASEIVAGTIQDHERGIVMGVQTFGKGTVQEVTSFIDGSSLRMTVAKWFTANGRDIDQVGIIPDIAVEITDEDVENEYDSQKEAAIEYLENL